MEDKEMIKKIRWRNEGADMGEMNVGLKIQENEKG